MEQELSDAGAGDPEVTQHLRRWASLLVEGTDQHMLGTDKLVTEVRRGRIRKREKQRAGSGRPSPCA